MNTTYKDGNQMRRAMTAIRRRQVLPICVKCGEETPHFSMSKENRQMCKDCWAMHDMDRFKVIEPEKEQEDE